MNSIPKSTFQELEFHKIIEEIEKFLLNKEWKSNIEQSKFTNTELLIQELNAVSEYNSSFENENPIEFYDYETIDEELKRMQIEDYILSIESFLKIKRLSEVFFKLQKSITKFKEYYPVLNDFIIKAEYDKEIVKKINKVISKYGEVKNNASPELEDIRRQFDEVRAEYKWQFDKSLNHYRKMDILNEINESEVDGYRVLAVKSHFKNRVKGKLRGMSKSGSILFMEPESVIKIVKKLQLLKEEEKKEVRRILQQLTFEISTHSVALEEYQKLIIELDRIQAKARYAREIGAVLPNISSSNEINLIEAYHPILLLQNKKTKEKTLPQNITLNEKQRIIAISGPNAGGKSITLKTIGLLQLMIQNGILVPVNPKSTMSFFGSILTDIGDNQSIENHLSTYSSRLQRMSQILPKADAKTLILIDEFGTGSDPELGGALAESMLEYLYERKSFCVLTTHYPNIKLKTEQLEHAQNASMLFDKESLSPMYKLEIGQAGSSFTFEVAEKNNIDKNLIDKAKGKLHSENANLESLLVNLQQEKYKVENLRSQLEKKTQLFEQKKVNIKDTEDKLIDKLSDFRILYDEENKKLQLGKKMEELINQSLEGKSKKDIVKKFLKLLEVEKYKKVQSEEQPKKKISQTKKKLKKDLSNKEEKVEKSVTEIKEKKKVELKEGMRVRMKGTTNVGTLDRIQKDKALVTYGNMTLNIHIKELEKVG